MTDFYLVTGFLGSGKTTFLGNFLRLLQPARVHLVINEYGAAGVDATLVQHLGAAVRQIAGGSIFCSCRLDQFEAALTEVAKDAPDAVVVEASGLSDPGGIRRILRQPPFEAAFRYRGAVCLVDPLRFEKALATARPCARQLSVSDLALVNKCDVASPAQLERTLELLAQRWPALRVRQTSFGRVEPAWLDFEPRAVGEDAAGHQRDLTLQKASVRVSPAMTATQLGYFIRAFAEETLRVKGILPLADGCWLADCVGIDLKLSPFAGPPPRDAGVLACLAGQGMALRKALRAAAALYPGLVEIL